MNQEYSLLIIEDDPAYLDNMAVILRMEGFRIRTAADGASALAMLREEIPDMILCDVMMPGIDGHALFGRLKEDELLADVPLIFVSALGGRDEIRKGMAMGADDYLTKPFTAEELISAIKGRLERLRTIRLRAAGSVRNKDAAWLRNQISKREREVLLLVGSGATSKQIADRLGISIRTVENHRTNLMNKLDAPNAAALAYWAHIAERE